WQNRDAAGSQLIVVVTVQQPVRAAGARPADGERIGTARRHLAARASIEKTVRICLLRSSWSQCRQLNKVAAVQRQLRNLLRINHLAKRGVRSLNGNLSRRHLYVGAH